VAANSPSPAAPDSVAALIVAHNQARRIASTVRAARAIPGVDLVLVVDDGSTDNTQDLARKASAVVVRHSHHRGRAAAIETGASVIAMRDEEGQPPRHLLLLDGSLGSFAVGAAPLVPLVGDGLTDLAVALTGDRKEGAADIASVLARSSVKRLSGWSPLEPLNRIRCLTREAFERTLPLSRGGALDLAMTLDVLTAGLRVTEVECEIRQKSSASSRRSALHRARDYRDVLLTVGSHGIRGGIAATGALVETATSWRDRPPRGAAAPAVGPPAAPTEPTKTPAPAKVTKTPPKSASSTSQKGAAKRPKQGESAP